MDRSLIIELVARGQKKKRNIQNQLQAARLMKTC